MQGNDVIHQLTKNKSSLYVSITLTNGTTLYQQYGTFSVNNETDNYRLYLDGPTEGTLGDSMLDSGSTGGDLSGMYFSTPDRENDKAPLYHCAIDFGGGGWWFHACCHAFLNGAWSSDSWHNPWYPLVSL
ncbi:fibroleukin-like, partial [Saccostrea cucullata]|uniref:fibroleukin-like n=1 Tax=Saccostrea cuccullata TaxID=36930 RepID=UPI002ED240D1